jgi:hypothetical protein
VQVGVLLCYFCYLLSFLITKFKGIWWRVSQNTTFRKLDLFRSQDVVVSIELSSWKRLFSDIARSIVLYLSRQDCLFFKMNLVLWARSHSDEKSIFPPALPSVRPCACSSATRTRRSSVKCDSGDCNENISMKSKFYYSQEKISDIVHEDPNTCYCFFLSFHRAFCRWFN